MKKKRYKITFNIYDNIKNKIITDDVFEENNLLLALSSIHGTIEIIIAEEENEN